MFIIIIIKYCACDAILASVIREFLRHWFALSGVFPFCDFLRVICLSIFLYNFGRVIMLLTALEHPDFSLSDN